MSCNLLEYAEVQLSVINDINFSPFPTQSYRMASEDLKKKHLSHIYIYITSFSRHICPNRLTFTMLICPN